MREAKIVIDGMSIPLIEKDSNKASSDKNDPHKSDLLKEITNMIKKSLAGIQDIKYQKKRHGIFHNMPPVPPMPRRLDDYVFKNSRATKNKKFPKVDLGDGCGKLLIKTHLNNIWKSVHSIENDIEYGIFEKLCIIEYELSCINKAKLSWIKSKTEPYNSCLHQNK